tara:strand:- start:716 stop:886 length:171 start_codon:yes stop_codon:yes gene_type:complete
MTEHKESVEAQKKRIEEERADNNQIFYYYQKNEAGERYSLTKFESGREVRENFKDD